MNDPNNASLPDSQFSMHFYHHDSIPLSLEEKLPFRGPGTCNECGYDRNKNEKVLLEHFPLLYKAVERKKLCEDCERRQCAYNREQDRIQIEKVKNNNIKLQNYWENRRIQERKNRMEKFRKEKAERDKIQNELPDEILKFLESQDQDEKENDRSQGGRIDCRGNEHGVLTNEAPDDSLPAHLWLQNEGFTNTQTNLHIRDLLEKSENEPSLIERIFQKPKEKKIPKISIDAFYGKKSITAYKMIQTDKNHDYKKITSEKPTIDFNYWRAKTENKLVNEGDCLISLTFYDVFARNFEKNNYKIPADIEKEYLFRKRWLYQIENDLKNIELDSRQKLRREYLIKRFKSMNERFKNYQTLGLQIEVCGFRDLSGSTETGLYCPFCKITEPCSHCPG